MIDGGILLGLRGATAALRLRLRFAGPAVRPSPPPAEDPLRVLFLAHYPTSNAGTRHRALAWVRRLRAAGHHAELLLPAGGGRAERLFRGWSRWQRAEYHLRMLRSRARAVRRAGDFHVTVILMNDLPHWEYGSPFVAAALRRVCGRVLLDLDDLPVFRGATEIADRARQLAGCVDGLILGNRSLERHFPDHPTFRTPTCVDPAKWDVPDRGAREGPPVFGWIGTAGNFGPLERLAPVLARVCETTGARLRVICDREPDLPGVPVEFVPWSADGEAAALAGVDVGLAPLDDGPMERCKCGLKALQYMASGAPVVASPVGVLREMVEGRGCGRLASTAGDWEQALTEFATDRAARLSAGQTARGEVETRWSYRAHESRLVQALRAGPHRSPGRHA